MFSFARLGLARQYLIISFLILLAGMLIIGVWVGQQIEMGVLHRTAAVTALYMNSFVAPYLQDLAYTSQLDAQHQAQLSALVTDTPLGQRIVAFKVWAPDGHILYSTNPALIGLQFPMKSELVHAFNGEVHTEISDLTAPENQYERSQWSRLIETYAPIRLTGTDRIIAVSEFYQTTDELERDLSAAQFRSWLVVGTAMLAMYVLLAVFVGRASHIILVQERELRDKVTQLTALLTQNEQLHKRIRQAAAQAAALNEQFLRRLSADLHDGPGQDLGLALLRIESLAEMCAASALTPTESRLMAEDFRTVQTALESALADLRTISAGLRLPELTQLSPAEVAERAVSDYESKTGLTVGLVLATLPETAPLPVKIALYRLLQEALVNGFRHAAGAEQNIRVGIDRGQLSVEIADRGAGFDLQAVPKDGHLGLAGMQERVETLGGTFQIQTAPQQGTAIRAWLPLELPEIEN